jgi:glutamine amidotransferase
MIGIVNYGLGNVHAIATIYRRSNIPAAIVGTAGELRTATRIILPGVGAFDHAMDRLQRSGMRETLDELVQVRRTPVLGICVGMQMLARRSDEGSLPGLGWIDGEVRRFDVTRFASPTHLPHMGWNDVQPSRPSALLQGLETGARFYFLHSYYFAPDRPEDVLTQTNYHGVFASGVARGHVHGVQFHPEKSHQWGIQLLRNFAALTAC